LEGNKCKKVCEDPEKCEEEPKSDININWKDIYRFELNSDKENNYEGFEGVNNAILLDASNEAKNTNGFFPFSCWYFQQCRMEEISHFATINCATQGFLMIGSYTKTAFTFNDRMTLNRNVQFRIITGIDVLDVGYGQQTGYYMKKNTYMSMNSGNIISNNQDLNDFKTSGVYMSNSWTTSQTLANCPTGLAFRMEVFANTGANEPEFDSYINIAQKVIDTNMNVFYRSISYNYDTSTWTYGTWKKVTMTAVS
jgi:hypothetical protein